MEMTAAVLYEPNEPLVIETLELDDPKDGEVLVRIAAAGVCYSDYHVMKGEWTMPCRWCSGMKAPGWWRRSAPGSRG